MAQHSRKCPKNFSCYVRGKLLGSGAFANVYACRKSDDEEQIFAVKAIDLQAMKLSGRGERELHKLQREASILKRVKTHSGVVQFVDSLEHEDWWLFILEYVPGGNLLQLINKRRGSEPLREHEVLCIFRQLVEGLQHLHNEAVIHRDLKLENVLVVQEGSSKKEFKVKITDFGLSKEVGDGMSTACSTVGSAKYVAPEVLASGTHDFKADLFSLGILLFVLLGSRFPFDGNSQAAKETQASIDAELLRLKVSESARSVLLGLLRIKAEERLTLENLIQHEWLVSTPATPTPKAKRRKLQALASVQESASASSVAPAACVAASGSEESLLRQPARSSEPRIIVSAAPGSPIAEALAVAAIPAVAATPIRPVIAPQNRRRSWVDCTPEESENQFVVQQEKLQAMIAKGFDSTMAEFALNSADWNVATAILMLEG